MERKSRENRVQFVQGLLRPVNLPRNKKGTMDGRTMVSSRNRKIPNNILASSSISSLIAKNATMAGDPTKVDSETQVRYPDKELLSQVKKDIDRDSCKTTVIIGLSSCILLDNGIIFP